MLHRLLLAAALVVVVPNFVLASPCAPGSLASYIGLGAGGCQIGASTFFDFGSGPSFFGGDEIDPSQISVIPILSGTGLDFVLSASADAGEILGIAIGYSVSGFDFFHAELSMTGSAATNDGVVSAVEDLCLGDVFFLTPGTCNGGPVTLITLHDFFGPTGPDSESFSPASFFDVFVDITIDGGPSGSASVDTVRNQFIAPEPSSILLVGAGLVALFAGRRRVRSNT